MKRYSASLVALCMLGCAMFGGGPRVGEIGSAAQSPPAVEPAADVTTQQGILNAITKLETEVAGIKAGRDSFAGVTLQSAAPWSLMPLMAWSMFLSHRRETMRIKEGKP